MPMNGFEKSASVRPNCPEEAPAGGLLDTLGDDIAAHAIASRECRKE